MAGWLVKQRRDNLVTANGSPIVAFKQLKKPNVAAAY